MSDASQFYIKPASRARAAAFILGNLTVTALLMMFVFTRGEPNPDIALSDVLFEAFSTLTVFAIFAAASLVVVTVTSMPLLLLGLFLFQTGQLLGFADEIVIHSIILWSIIGDAMILAGELILAAVAIYFVQISFRIANLDGLTGLYNRNFHTHRMVDILEKASEKNRQVGVIAIDLDRFKVINDAHGHAYGDSVLQHTGRLLKRFRRGGNVVSRTGGEEFEMLVADTNPDDLLALAETVRQTLEDHPPAKLETFTASIGVALSREQDTFKTLRARADAGAYTAKKTGRNRVCMIDD